MAVNPLSSRHMISSTLLVSNNHKPVCVCARDRRHNGAEEFWKIWQDHACMCPLSQNNEGFVNKMPLDHTVMTESKNKICHCTIDS